MNKIKILLTLVIILFSANALATPYSNPSSALIGKGNVQYNVIDTRSQVLYQEVHMVYNGSSSSSSPPSTDCGNGKIKQAPALLGNTFWVYTCLVSLTPYDIKNSARYTAEVAGFYTANSSTNDQATLMWRNGYPTSSYWTFNMMYWGSTSVSNTLAGYTYPSATDDFNLNFYTSNGGSEVAGSVLGSTSIGQPIATITATFYPGQTFYVQKSVSSSSDSLHCQGYYTVQASDIGQTSFMDCCATSAWPVSTGDTACPTCGWHTTVIKTNLGTIMAGGRCS